MKSVWMKNASPKASYAEKSSVPPMKPASTKNVFSKAICVMENFVVLMRLVLRTSAARPGIAEA